MLKMKGTNQSSGVYHARDAIENFHIRVSLRKLHSIIKIPKFEAFQSTSTDQQQLTRADYEEVLAVKWQQKIFSKTEQAYYAQKENCKTELEKRYYQMVKEMRGEESTENRMIFTYIDDDNYQPSDNFGPQEVKQSSLRRNVESKQIKNDDKSIAIFVDPNQESIPSRYNIGYDFVKMFIMADLEPTTLLVTILYRQSDGLFIIFPDFNSMDNEYHLEIDQNSKQLYGYFVENLSTTFNDATNEHAQKEKLSQLQIETCELMRKLKISKDPDFVYPKFCRIVLMIEIIDACDFEYDNIHVQFHIKLPKFVRVVEGILTGATHSSFKSGGTWNFGYCHSLVLDIEDEFLLSTTKVDSIVIDFEIISIDSFWERERREGIASLKLPLERKAKKELHEIQCFRDLQGGSWLWDFIERFFLGGIHKTQMLEHPNDEVANLYGTQTVSTGRLRVKVQKIVQTQMSKRSYLHMKSVDEIISSYHKAKAKLSL